MRIALLGTPRSGNNWIRAVLADTLQLEPIGVFNYFEAPQPLPKNCILNIHWYREPNFQRYLRENGFKTIALARHPIDVLVSVLAFVRHEALAKNWLDGNVEIPEELAGCDPTSELFQNYATSFGSENLLSVGYYWWHDETSIKIRYEDVVADPVAKFVQLVNALGGETSELQKALRKFDLTYFQRLPNRHGWQGKPNLWRKLVLAKNAKRILARHRNVFEAQGYQVSPDYLLTKSTAKKNWLALA